MCGLISHLGSLSGHLVGVADLRNLGAGHHSLGFDVVIVVCFWLSPFSFGFHSSTLISFPGLLTVCSLSLFL